MKICSTCGNEIPVEAGKCPFCDSAQAPEKTSWGTGREKIRTVNLKKDRPLVEEALDRLSSELSLARSQGGQGPPDHSRLRLLGDGRQHPAGGDSGAGGPVPGQADSDLCAGRPVLGAHQRGPRSAEKIPGSACRTRDGPRESRNHAGSALEDFRFDASGAQRLT